MEKDFQKRLINFWNKHFPDYKISYAYNLFFECYFYNFDFEEGELCLM